MTKILVIEDDIDLRANLVDLLELEGYEVVFAENGEEGLSRVYQDQPDLVVCDIMMPKLSGFEVLKELRARQDNYVIPVIFLTARADRASIRQGMEMGADDFLTKPFTQQELLRSIRTQLEKRTALRNWLIQKP
jgi:DNA-binding response OmpR family regulator